MNALKKVEVTVTPKSNGEKITPPAIAVTTKKENETLPPLEDRLHRLNQLFNLQTQYNKLQESLQKLSDFEIKKDGERSRLSIQDDCRNEFSTYNTEIVEEVVKHLKIRIREKIKALEPQLKW